MLSCDTIVEGVHFLKDDPPDSIGHKALAVNLSDLAAKGARPYVYLLALTLPAEPSPSWLEAFASGLRALQDRAGIALVGGDTTRIARSLEHHHHRARPRAPRPCRAAARGQARRPSLCDRHDRRCLSRPSRAQRAGACPRLGFSEEDRASRHRALSPSPAAQRTRRHPAQFRPRRDRRVGRARRRHRQACERLAMSAP